MTGFTLYAANCRGNRANTLYPVRKAVTDTASLEDAVKHDHVMAEYRDGYRSSANFIRSDVIPMDIDNEGVTDEQDFITPEKLHEAFPGVPFAVVYSRHHMKQKGQEGPRPRFHVFFPVPEITDPDAYAEVKRQLKAYFPAFDGNALDAARFFFGTASPKADAFEGQTDVVASLAGHADEVDAFAAMEPPKDSIDEGKRNSHLSQFAGKLLIRYGDTDEARNAFLEEAAKCDPPLADRELSSIWKSAVKFAGKVSKKPNYIPPAQYKGDMSMMPEDMTDVGQAKVLAKEYGHTKLLYSTGTDFLVYNGSYFEESKPLAQAVEHDLTGRQLEEAKNAKKKYMAEMKKSGALANLMAKAPLSKKQQQAADAYTAAEAYEKFAIKMRDSRKVTAALKEVRPMVVVEPGELDKDPFLLNTPSGTYDLRQGLSSMKGHDPGNMITKQTLCGPGDLGRDIWDSALDTFFQGNDDLKRYVQRIVGLASIGKVFLEALVIAFGGGKNGKSSFWNAVAKVLGSYSGNISADTLTAGCKRNVKPELAEARGKRLLIAAELEEGMRLNTSTAKQLSSTDPVYAEPKYCKPFKYIPSHTLVLYTNHLPRVAALDKGTWRRLIVIPFNAVIEEKSDIKNFADYLVEHAGPAILTWIIEGAKEVIDMNYHIPTPDAVTDACSTYKEDNDWMGRFLDEKCVIDEKAEAKSGELFSAYRSYCLNTGEYARSTTDFYAALDACGFERRRKKGGNYIKGVRLKTDFDGFLE